MSVAEAISLMISFGIFILANHPSSGGIKQLGVPLTYIDRQQKK